MDTNEVGILLSLGTIDRELPELFVICLEQLDYWFHIDLVVPFHGIEYFSMFRGQVQDEGGTPRKLPPLYVVTKPLFAYVAHICFNPFPLPALEFRDNVIEGATVKVVNDIVQFDLLNGQVGRSDPLN